jgi:hypothetical protein
MVLTSGNDVPRLAQQLSLSPQEKIRLVLKKMPQSVFIASKTSFWVAAAGGVTSFVVFASGKNVP